MIEARHYPGRVRRVFTGDSFEAEIDLGFGVHLVKTLDLHGCEAPQLEAVNGHQSRAWLRGVLQGQTVVLGTFRDSPEIGAATYSAVVYRKGAGIAREAETINQLAIAGGWCKRRTL